MERGMWVRFIFLIAVLLNEEDEVSGRYDFEEIEQLNKNHLEGIYMFNVNFATLLCSSS